MSWPESAPASNRVLRAAEKWLDAKRAANDMLTGPILEFTEEAMDVMEQEVITQIELVEAIDAYRATGVLEQANIAKEAGD